MGAWSKKTSRPGALPDFLQTTVEKGIVDEHTAQRIELHRRSRGLGRLGILSCLLDSAPDPNLTFDNFVQCRGNSFALELAKTVACQSPSELPYNPLYIYGAVGLGKTHLLSAIANQAQDKVSILANTADLEVELEHAKGRNARAELRQWLVSADILLVDDIQMCEGNEELQRELFSILNHMIRERRWIVISSDVPPTQLAGIQNRLLSRLGGGVIISLQMGDRAERIELLQHFLQEKPVSHDVVDYLAQHVTDNIRRLKAVVSQLLMLSQISHSSVSLEMARSITLEDQQGPIPEMAADLGPVIEPAPPEPQQDVKDRFKEMLTAAESEQEQALALQIAVGERIRQLKKSGSDGESLQRFETALEALREGKLEEAIGLLGF
jgi:chromosomal replication initiator protein DnaA